MNTLPSTFHNCRQPAFSALKFTNRFRSRWTDLDKSSNFHTLKLFRPKNQVTICYLEYEIIVDTHIKDCSFHLRVPLAAVSTGVFPHAAAGLTLLTPGTDKMLQHGSAKAPQNRIVMPKRNSIADVTYGHVGTRKYEN